MTLVEGQPLVEAVEAEDFDRSQLLLSLIRLTKKHLRPGGAIPPEYANFDVVVFWEEVVGPARVWQPRRKAAL